MRIAVFHLGFFYSGGGEKLVLEQIRGLRERGHEVVCFAPVLDRKRCFPNLISDYDIRLLAPQLPAWVPDGPMLQVLLACGLFPFTLRWYRGFDVVLAANQPSAYFGWVIKKVLGIPYITYLAQPTRHLYPRQVDLETRFKMSGGQGSAHFLAKLARPLVKYLDQLSVQEAKVLLTNGKYIGRRLGQVYQRDWVDCPAGCWPPESCPPVTPRFEGVPYILITNRHFPQKKFEYGLEALSLVIKQVPKARLVITGARTWYSQHLDRLAESLRVSSRIIYTGLVDEGALKDLYAQAAVYLYTAPEEDFGMGVVEAMAQGTPVVAWNSGGPSMTVTDGVTGYLARPFEVEDLAAKICQVMKGPSDNYRQLSEAAHRQAVSVFSYNAHHNRVEKWLGEARNTRNENRKAQKRREIYE